MRYDEKVNLRIRVISHLVRCFWWDPHSLAGTEDDSTAIHLHYGLPREHVEKLLRAMVKVANLGRGPRHTLLNHAELRILYQVPAITMVAPAVMLGGCFADCAVFHENKKNSPQPDGRMRAPLRGRFWWLQT